MPQIDFRQAFSTKDDLSPQIEPDLSRIELPGADSGDPKVVRQIHLSRSHWANIGFVACACLGALLTAVYLFNGGELLRAAAAWPRELLYHPPRTGGQGTVAKSENPSPDATANSPVKGGADWDRSGDPFSRNHPQLNLNPNSPIGPNRGTNGTASSSADSSAQPSLLRDLGLPAPGGDALSRTLNQGAELTQGAASESSRSIAAAQTNAAKAQQQATARAREKLTSKRPKIQGVTQKVRANKTVSQPKPQVSATRTSVPATITNSSAGTMSPTISGGQQLGTLGGASGLGRGSQIGFRGPGR